MASTVQVMKPELDLFAAIPLQRDILRVETVVVNPITTLDSSNIDFVCPGNSETYKDVSNVYLRLVVQLTAPTVDNTEEKDASVVNNLIHSLFSHCSIYLSNVNVSSNEGNFGYRCYFEKLLNYGTEAGETHLQTGGWFLDSGKIDSTTGNTGLDARKEWLTNGKTVELIHRISSDFFNQMKYLISNVDLRVNLVKADEKFYLMGKDSDTSKLKILAANLFIDHAYVNPSLIMAHHKLLESKKFITYPIRRMQIRHYTIQKGCFVANIENASLGIVPSVAIIGLVSSEAYVGKRSRNPYNFQHFNLSSLQLSVNGQQFPARPLEMNFSKDKPMYAQAYFSMCKALQIHRTDRANQVTMSNFSKGFALYITDLTKDRNYGGMCASPITEGALRIEAKFSEATTENITAVVGLEFEGAIQIDQNKSVSVLY